jgi:hypothetical protein
VPLRCCRWPRVRCRWTWSTSGPLFTRTPPACGPLSPRTTAQVGGHGSLGDIPLIVIPAGLPIAETEPGLGLIPQDADRIDSIWRNLQEDHLTRSTNARIMVAENSGHYVYLDEPALVVDAIHDLTTTE